MANIVHLHFAVAVSEDGVAAYRVKFPEFAEETTAYSLVREAIASWGSDGLLDIDAETTGEETVGTVWEPIETEPLKLAVMVAQKVQPAQYESAEVSLHVSGITVEHTDEEVDDLIERGQVVYQKMGEKVAQAAKAARRGGGF